MYKHYLSKETAANVLTEAPTATAWRYGMALHKNDPYSHSEKDGKDPISPDGYNLISPDG